MRLPAHRDAPANCKAMGQSVKDSGLFGIQDTVGPELQRQLQRYTSAASRAALSTTKEERKKLAAQNAPLRERLRKQRSWQGARTMAEIHGLPEVEEADEIAWTFRTYDA